MSTNLYDCFGDYMITLAPIYEHEEDDYLINPANEIQDRQLDSGKYDRTSTPSSVSSDATGEEDVINDGLKPISPAVELKFEKEGGDDAVVAENQSRYEKTYFHFDRKPYIEDVEISETRDMVIVDESHFHHVHDNALDQRILKLDEDSKVPESPAAPDENENTQRQGSDSFDSSSSSDENEYHTEQDTTRHEFSDLIYHTAYVDDISDEESENAPELNGTYERVKERVDTPDPATSSNDIPDIHDVVPISPYSLYRVPADIVVERQQETESSDESTTDVASYVSDDVEREVTFTDDGVGNDDVALKPCGFTVKENEIMINFPPYFEIATRKDFDKIHSHQHTVTPARQEAVCASLKKPSTGQRDAHANPAYETESDSQPCTSRDYVSIEFRQAIHRKETPSQAIVMPTPYARNVIENTQRETGTPTKGSLTQDIVPIINDMNDIPRTAPSSESSEHASPAYRGGPTIVIKTQYQRTLPTSDRDVAITQASDLENSRPPRCGSVNSSTRHKTRDPEAVSERKEVRRSIIRRASNVISEQFEKAVVITNKYQKQITIVTVLLILTMGALAAMLAVFPLT